MKVEEIESVRLQAHANHLGEMLTEQFKIRVELEERIRELEEGMREFLNTYKPYYDSGVSGIGIRIYEELQKLLENK